MRIHTEAIYSHRDRRVLNNQILSSVPIPVGPTPRSRVPPTPEVFYRQKHRLEGPESGLIDLIGVEITQGHETWTHSGSTLARREMHEPLRKLRPWRIRRDVLCPRTYAHVEMS